MDLLLLLWEPISAFLLQRQLPHNALIGAPSSFRAPALKKSNFGTLHFDLAPSEWRSRSPELPKAILISAPIKWKQSLHLSNGEKGNSAAEALLIKTQQFECPQIYIRISYSNEILEYAQGTKYKLCCENKSERACLAPALPNWCWWSIFLIFQIVKKSS